MVTSPRLLCCLLIFLRLWDVIRDHEEVIPIARLAEDHYKEHGRPLRIAVDEADWRFNNLTQAQVYAIRDCTCYIRQVL